jgi:sodium/pantothenate symporter
LLVSLNPPPLLIWINLFAFGGLEAAFLWPTILGLYWKRANASGVIASMVVGIGSFIVFNQFGIVFISPRVNAIVPAIVLSFVAMVVVSFLTPAPKKEVLDTFFKA